MVFVRLVNFSLFRFCNTWSISYQLLVTDRRWLHWVGCAFQTWKGTLRSIGKSSVSRSQVIECIQMGLGTRIDLQILKIKFWMLVRPMILSLRVEQVIASLPRASFALDLQVRHLIPEETRGSVVVQKSKLSKRHCLTELN